METDRLQAVLYIGADALLMSVSIWLYFPVPSSPTPRSPTPGSTTGGAPRAPGHDGDVVLFAVALAVTVASSPAPATPPCSSCSSPLRSTPCSAAARRAGSTHRSPRAERTASAPADRRAGHSVRATQPRPRCPHSPRPAGTQRAPGGPGHGASRASVHGNSPRPPRSARAPDGHLRPGDRDRSRPAPVGRHRGPSLLELLFGLVNVPVAPTFLSVVVLVLVTRALLGRKAGRAVAGRRLPGGGHPVGGGRTAARRPDRDRRAVAHPRLLRARRRRRGHRRGPWSFLVLL